MYTIYSLLLYSRNQHNTAYVRQAEKVRQSDFRRQIGSQPTLSKAYYVIKVPWKIEKVQQRQQGLFYQPRLPQYVIISAIICHNISLRLSQQPAHRETRFNLGLEELGNPPSGFAWRIPWYSSGVTVHEKSHKESRIRLK